MGYESIELPFVMSALRAVGTGIQSFFLINSRAIVKARKQKE